MTVTAAQIISEIRTVAAEQPDFVYHHPDGRNCQYVEHKDDTFVPGCIVGQALWRLHAIDGSFFDCAHNDSGVEDALGYLGIHTSRDGLYWLEAVQGQQDGGRPWGEAVRVADKAVASLV